MSYCSITFLCAYRAFCLAVEIEVVVMFVFKINILFNIQYVYIQEKTRRKKTSMLYRTIVKFFLSIFWTEFLIFLPSKSVCEYDLIFKGLKKKLGRLG